MALNKAWFALLGLALLASACTTTTDGVEKPPLDLNRAAKADTDLATGYYTFKQYQVAIDEANTALSKVPDYAPAYNLLGLIYMALPDLPQAEAYFRKALAIDPTNPDINHNFGVFLCQNGHAEASLDYFRNAYTNDLYATPEKSLDNAGLCLLQLKRTQEGQKMFEAALAKNAQDSTALYNLATLSFKNSDLDRAHTYLQRLNNAGGGTTPDALILGWRLERAKGNDAAAADYAGRLKKNFADSPQAKQLND